MKDKFRVVCVASDKYIVYERQDRERFICEASRMADAKRIIEALRAKEKESEGDGAR